MNEFVLFLKANEETREGGEKGYYGSPAAVYQALIRWREGCPVLVLFFFYYAQQAVTRKCKFQIAFIRPAGNAPRRKDATMEIVSL